jgi:hypothetical protein
VSADDVVVGTMGDASTPIIQEAWQLNKRHYGALQEGLAKNDPELHARS